MLGKFNITEITSDRPKTNLWFLNPLEKQAVRRHFAASRPRDSLTLLSIV
jgi:hypothetical protein